MNILDLAENSGLEVDEYIELIDVFVSRSRCDFDDLMSALGQGDGKAASRAAHSIKGAAGNLGLASLYETAKDIEKTALGGALEEARNLVVKLKEGLEEIATLAQKQTKDEP